MKHLIQKLKSAMLILLLVITSVPLSSLTALAAGESSVQNPEPVTLADGTVLKKTVEPVPGMINKWKVTLRVEAKKSAKTSDTILVIDRSGSMAENGRMTKAKEAARNLIDSLLTTGNTTNRVAVLSFAGEVTTNSGFTSSNSTAKSAVNSLNATGGTFTQAGMRQASQLMNTSTADIKTIILLSDGEPTYCYDVNNPWKMDVANLIPYGNLGWQTPATIPQSEFTATQVGAGSSMYQRYDNQFGTSNDKYYNCGNHAIAEAGFYKTANIGSLYTIALEAGTNGDAVLSQMATPGKSYTATPAQLNTIFNEIAGEIKSAVQNAIVDDFMGNGVVAVSTGANSNLTDGGKKLIWNLGTPTQQEGDKFVAELSYEIELDQDILNATASADGFYSANAEAKITYNGNQTGLFPVPKIKPTFVKIKKELIGDDACQNCKFTVNLTSGTQVISRDLLPGETNTATIYEAMPVDAVYAVSETAAKDNTGTTISLNQYATEFAPTTINAGAFGDDAMVTVINTLKTRSVVVRKVWVGKPATSVTVKLKADGVESGEAILSADNNWQHEFTNMPAINRYSGENVVYTLEETQLDGYTAPAYSTDNSGALVVTNTYVPKKIEVTGKKSWIGGVKFNNGVRPDVKLQLKRNGVALGEPFTLTNGVTTHTWTNLDETDIDGNVYTYTVDEVEVPENYLKTNGADGFTVINTFNAPKSNIKATKLWVNGPAPVAIEFQLYRKIATENEAQKVGLPVTLQPGMLEYIWIDMPATDNDGNIYTYSAKEITALPNFNQTYGATELDVINTYNVPTNGTAAATKVWIGGPAQRPTIWFKLYRQITGGELEEVPESEAPVKELLSGTTDALWDNLSETDIKGNKYTFSVKEVNAQGENQAPENYTKSGDGTLSITNTYVSPKIDVTVRKEWNGGKERPAITAQLYRDNVALDGKTVALSADNNWTGTWSDLDKTDENGVAYVYTAKETEVPENYGSSESNENGVLIITNTYSIPKDKVTATKVWVNGPADNRPTVWFKLYRQIENGVLEAVPGVTIHKIPGSNKTTWSNIEQTDINGNQYTFSVKEVNANGVEFEPTDYVKSGEGTLTITNTYKQPMTDENVVATKIWDGGENFEGGRRPAVQFELWRKNGTAGAGEKVVEATLVENDQVDFGQQLKTDINGVEYEYYVVEITELEHYEKTENGLTVTNKFIPPTWNPGATKKWQGGSMVRPPFVIVNLYRRLDGGDKELVGSRNLDALNNWTTVWNGMPETDEAGNYYEYWLEEDEVLSFELEDINYENEIAILTNTYTSPLTHIAIEKQWNDSFEIHESINVDILRNGDVIETVVLSENNRWSYNADFDATDEEGNPYTYGVRESTNLVNYTTEIVQKYYAEDNLLSFVITNTYVEPKVPMTGSGSHYLIMLILGNLLIMLGFVTRRLAKQIA